jgi:hypothetical protein
MSIKDSARKQFEERRSLLNEIDVPEWGGKIYYRALTGKEQLLITKDDPSIEERAMRTFLHRALDADGKHLFVPAERIEIERHYDPVIVDRIANEMFRFDYTREEAAKK